MNNKCWCRRHFLQGLITGSISLSLLLQLPESAQASGQAKALVLSCIDFRFVDGEKNFLNTKSLDNSYDWLTLAGASLALAGFPKPAETETFWDHLDLSYRLHHIQKVIILDHQDCGAYATFIDANLTQNPQKEEQIHQQYLSQAYQSIKQKYPQLEVELYWIKLNQEVKRIIPLT